MSKPTARAKPARSATKVAPTTPPAGPESSAFGPRKRSASVRPPEDCMKRSCASGSAARSAAACPRNSGVRYASTAVVSARASRPASFATSCETATCSKPTSRASTASARSISGYAVAWISAIATARCPCARACASASRAAARSGGSTTSPSRTDAPAHFEHGARQRRGLADRELEQLGPLLGADREQVAEARVGDEQRRIPRAARAARSSRRSCRARRARAVAQHPARARRRVRAPVARAAPAPRRKTAPSRCAARRRAPRRCHR